ncbi:hypothetical protein AB6A40_007903 [Gnathostoma spinigerum]|uniref:Uncharacterized protein n=1 Tax=Gnathostoma spinigerum TaxID=75299 RepID=A0ABD6EMK1_9BILA
MFPKGPRTVTAAYTNLRKGVTILFEHKTAYRFRWSKKKKRFHLARRSPQDTSHSMPITPRVGFTWFDGNNVLLERDTFVVYDAFQNHVRFHAKVSDYFPNLPDDMIGIVYSQGDNMLIYTASHTIQVYDKKKYRVRQTYPIEMSKFVGCAPR